ncbi:hypothetical protein K438DRAFT_1976103 [Mycena galopus ATCC 62051]|nr:hypothetical protein K438DRAFT_1976103 [Mycena galopus ATCC 62051]
MDQGGTGTPSDHLATKAKAIPDFRYTLILTGAFSEWAVGPRGVDLEKHIVMAYGFPEKEISITAMKECVFFVWELMWAGKTLGSAGRVMIPLLLENDKFDFKPEPLKAILQRALQGN